MALVEYRKLCPKSGHVLSHEERESLGAGGRTASRARSMRCGICGHIVAVCPDPGTGQSLLYAMHRRDGAGFAGSCPKGST